MISSVQKLFYIVLSFHICSTNCQQNVEKYSAPIADFTVVSDTNESAIFTENASVSVDDNTLIENFTHPNLANLNQSQSNVSVVTNATLIRKFSCLLEEVNEETNATFHLINGTTLLTLLKQNPNITSRSQPASCQIVLFYAPWCPFSIQAAPHLNALPRGFPMLRFHAIDAHLHNSLSTMQGVMAIPSLFLFHNGKAAARYNETEYKVDLFGAFITRYTGIEPIGILNRTSSDFLGPLPTVIVESTDPWLILSWVVLFISIIYWFTRSNFFWSLIENIRNTWREAEAQHEHVD